MPAPYPTGVTPTYALGSTCHVRAKSNTAYENKSQCPNPIEIEPAARDELQTEILVDEPSQATASRNHRQRMHGGNDDCHAQIGGDEPAPRLMSGMVIGSTAETEIDGDEHQSGAVRDRHGKGPEGKLRRPYTRQHARMA